MTTPRQPLTRRRLLKRSLIAGGAAVLGTGLYAWQVEPFWWQAVGVDLPIRLLPSSLDGATLVQVSDLHVGPRVDADYLREALGAIRAYEPDLLVLTGDVVHYTAPHDTEVAARVLDAMPLGRLGTFAVLGNHDYGRAWSEDRAADRVVGRLEGRGVRVLRNDVAEAAGLQVVGLDDLWAGAFSPAHVLPRVDPSRPSLALCHNPDGVDEEGWGDWKGWVLSGHTHGGQCKPPFLPPPLLPVRNKRYTRGAFDLGDGRHLYVNAGLGWLRQVRLGVRPEITVFTLRRGA